ncbi:alpha/beta hydrolase [Patescibacteria group bacterium]|nr:alpha/beta hydrolase [Patescibacteria group bacterium]MBU1563788.1 alpha/beta hydrolase [Patescibacteria group bacterium]MBU2068052.1 alpha/beta hydrolase [Patescibacteria group bacterium]
MKTAIILHGMPSKKEYYNPKSSAQSNKHWIPWIQRQLILNDILAQTPELPEPYEPVYEKWASVFNKFQVDENTILIGHSCGAGFLIRWLSENKVKVGKVVLVAPYLDSDHDLKTGFFDFEINEDMISRTKGITIFVSTDDDKDILASTEELRSKLKNIQIKEFTNKGHFTFGGMKTEEFPELKEEVLK